MFLGRSVGKTRAFSEETAKKIDSEVMKLITRIYKEAEKILKDNIDKMHAMAEALMQFETIGDDQIKDIMAGKKPKPPTDPVKKKKTRATKASTKSTKKEESVASPATDTGTIVLEEALEDKK